MATIAALTEDFTGATVGTTVSTANTIFDNVSGLGTSTFITDPFDGTRRMIEVISSANSRTHEMDFTATPTLWFRFDIDFETPLDVVTAIINGYDVAAATNKIFDLRQVAATRQLQMRNVNTNVWTSVALSDNTKYRIFLYMKVDTAKVIRCMVYGGANLDTLVDDSTEITSTTVATTVGHLRLGNLTASTGTMRFGRLRGDDSTQPFDAPVGGTVWTRGIAVSIGG